MKMKGTVLVGALLVVITICGVLPLIYNINYITDYARRMASHQRSDVFQVREGDGSVQTAAEESPPQDRQPSRLGAVEVGRRFQRRLQRYHRACREYGNSSLFRRLSPTARILRVGAHWPVMNVSVGYCPIEKTGSTTWRGYLHAIRTRMERVGVQTSTSVGGSVKEVTFLFVRQPYHRLLSAYVDKLFCPNTRYWPLGRYIVRHFRPQPSNLSLACGHDVSFPEFVRYVLHSQETGQNRDGHFVPTHDHCALCTNTTYDYIGHLETVGEDTAYLLRVLQSPVKRRTRFDSRTIRNNAGWVLTRMAPDIRRCMSMKEACLRLWKKWHIRGILSKTEPLPVRAEVLPTAAFVRLSLQAQARSAPRVDRQDQKAEALTQAFAAVPLEHRLALRKLLFLDFELFGFDPSPKSVFPSDPTDFLDSGEYRYFDLSN